MQDGLQTRVASWEQIVLVQHFEYWYVIVLFWCLIYSKFDPISETFGRAVKSKLKVR